MSQPPLKPSQHPDCTGGISSLTPKLMDEAISVVVNLGGKLHVWPPTTGLRNANISAALIRTDSGLEIWVPTTRTLSAQPIQLSAPGVVVRALNCTATPDGRVRYEFIHQNPPGVKRKDFRFQGRLVTWEIVDCA